VTKSMDRRRVLRSPKGTKQPRLFVIALSIASRVMVEAFTIVLKMREVYASCYLIAGCFLCSGCLGGGRFGPFRP